MSKRKGTRADDQLRKNIIEERVINHCNGEHHPPAVTCRFVGRAPPTQTTVSSLPDKNVARLCTRVADLLDHRELSFLERIARRLCRDWCGLLSLAELCSVGYIALGEAAKRFDEHKLTPFPAYAYKWVHGAMLKELKAEHKVRRAMSKAGYVAMASLADDADVGPDGEQQHYQQIGDFCAALAASMLGGAVSKASADESLSRAMGFADPDGTMRLRVLPKAIAMLDEQPAALIRRHWLDEVSLQQISEEQGIPYMTLKRRHQRALRSLARCLKRLLERCLAG